MNDLVVESYICCWNCRKRRQEIVWQASVSFSSSIVYFCLSFLQLVRKSELSQNCFHITNKASHGSVWSGPWTHLLVWPILVCSCSASFTPVIVVQSKLKRFEPNKVGMKAPKGSFLLDVLYVDISVEMDWVFCSYSAFILLVFVQLLGDDRDKEFFKSYIIKSSCWYICYYDAIK